MFTLGGVGAVQLKRRCSAAHAPGNQSGESAGIVQCKSACTYTNQAPPVSEEIRTHVGTKAD